MPFSTASGRRNRMLIIHAQKGDIETCTKLLDEGADVNFEDEAFGGVTPIFFAVLSGHSDICSLLVSRGANVSHLDSAGNEPLSYAASKGLKEVCALLLSHGASSTRIRTSAFSPLLAAADRGHTSVASLLLECGADGTCATDQLMTPLYIAATRSYTELFRIIFQHNAWDAGKWFVAV